MKTHEARPDTFLYFIKKRYIYKRVWGFNEFISVIDERGI
jgi:hypothetical protein